MLCYCNAANGLAEGVNSTWMPRVALGEPQQGQTASFEHPVLLYCRQGVGGATGVEATGRPEQRRENPPVEAQTASHKSRSQVRKNLSVQ